MLLIHFLEIIFLILLAAVFILYFKRINFVRKPKEENIKDVVQLYEYLMRILKVSKADSINLFKYRYSKRHIITHFLFSMRKNGRIIYNIPALDLPVSVNAFNLKILHSNDRDLHEIYKKDLDLGGIRDIYKSTVKFYYQNIFLENDDPIGYVVLAYNNDYNIPDRDKNLIIKILKEMKHLI